MNKLFEIATKISSGWSLAAFTIIALVLLIIKLKGRKIPSIAWAVVFAIVIVALAPILAPIYMNTYGIYRVRVVVLDEHQIPTDDAKVTCSIGGEVKKVGGGWECDIPAKSRPADGRMQAYATMREAFVAGHTEVELKDDYNPVVKVALVKLCPAKIMGIVLDDNEAPIEGVLIGVVGYESEVWTTQRGGNFSLLAHGAKGQQVELSASKDGYKSTTEWHQVGDFPVTIRLHKEHSSKHIS